MLESLKNKLWPSPTVKPENQVNPKKEDDMFDTMFNALKTETGIPHATSLMNAINQVLAHFSQEYVKDANLRDAAIDALCDILKSQKQTAQA